MNHIALGEKGEAAAVEYLRCHGYAVLRQKYRARTGEIDIIAKKDGVLVFVEVKTRRSTRYGLPAEAVTYRKQQKIIQTALCYLAQTQQPDALCRIDVIEVYEADGRINHLVNAFGRQ